MKSSVVMQSCIAHLNLPINAFIGKNYYPQLNWTLIFLADMAFILCDQFSHFVKMIAKIYIQMLNTKNKRKDEGNEYQSPSQ